MNPSESSSIEVAIQFRPKLMSIAYRMLGSSADAEDVVQDAYLRLHQATDVVNAEAWLVRTTTRLCIDRLRELKHRETYIGPWLPEPVHPRWEGAVTEIAPLAESLSMAFLLILETLSPSERATYLLREVFNYEFDEIATLIDKTPANVRQLLVRARQRIQEKKPRFETTQEEVDAVANQFLAVCRNGNLQDIEAMLTDDAILFSDGGGKVHAAPKPIEGSKRIAKLVSVVFRKLQTIGQLTLTTVNGQPGAVFTVDGRIYQIFSFTIESGRIQNVFVVLNPDKLSHWPVPSHN